MPTAPLAESSLPIPYQVRSARLLFARCQDCTADVGAKCAPGCSSETRLMDTGGRPELSCTEGDLTVGKRSRLCAFSTGELDDCVAEWALNASRQGGGKRHQNAFLRKWMDMRRGLQTLYVDMAGNPVGWTEGLVAMGIEAYDREHNNLIITIVIELDRRRAVTGYVRLNERGDIEADLTARPQVPEVVLERTRKQLSKFPGRTYHGYDVNGVRQA